MLATPYGPAATVRYYHLVLVDPPFAGRVTEWQLGRSRRSNDDVLLRARAIAAAALVWFGRRRLTGFDMAVLALTFAGGVSAIRGIPWFALACMVLLPVAIGHKLESRSPGEPRRGLNIVVATGLTTALVIVAGSLFLRDEAWFEDYWPREAVDAVQAELGPDDRLFAPDLFADWMLFKIPELRGRIAYDIRFEVYDEDFFAKQQDYNFEDGANWKSVADGYRIVILDERRTSHAKDFLAEPGTRAIYRNDDMTIVARPAS